MSKYKKQTTYDTFKAAGGGGEFELLPQILQVWQFKCFVFRHKSIRSRKKI